MLRRAQFRQRMPWSLIAVTLIVLLGVVQYSLHGPSMTALAAHEHAAEHHHHHHEHDHEHDHARGQDHHHEHEHEHGHQHKSDYHHNHHSHGKEHAHGTIASSNYWQLLQAFFPQDPAYAALTATAYVSLAPIAVLLFIPDQTSTNTLNTLVAFAVGSLLGDVFLHLLPHAFSPHTHGDEHEHEQSHSHGHEHEHDHDHMRGLWIGLAVLAGFMAFFSVDRFMRLVGGGAHQHHGHGHGDSESESEEVEGSKGKSTATDATSDKSRRRGKSAGNQATKSTGATTRPRAASLSLQLSAYLNLFADATHNFTDGLAVAAAFYASRSLGISTAVACFFHEIPHEIGDYAILLRSGFGRVRAATAQAVTALGAFAGTLVGIWLKSRGNAHSDASDIDLVMPFTAGGFVYVATVGVVPELLAARNVSLRDACKQILAMAVGVALMAVIALNE